MIPLKRGFLWYNSFLMSFEDPPETETVYNTLNIGSDIDLYHRSIRCTTYHIVDDTDIEDDIAHKLIIVDEDQKIYNIINLVPRKAPQEGPVGPGPETNLYPTSTAATDRSFRCVYMKRRIEGESVLWVRQAIWTNMGDFDFPGLRAREGELFSIPNRGSSPRYELRMRYRISRIERIPKRIYVIDNMHAYRQPLGDILSYSRNVL